MRPKHGVLLLQGCYRQRHREVAFHSVAISQEKGGMVRSRSLVEEDSWLEHGDQVARHMSSGAVEEAEGAERIGAEDVLTDTALQNYCCASQAEAGEEGQNGQLTLALPYS